MLKRLLGKAMASARSFAFVRLDLDSGTLAHGVADVGVSTADER